MKIISGTLKGRNVLGYNIDGTRPTMDRVKESLFGMIQNNLEDSVILDLFAGSGNLAFEALSNGGSFAYLVDNNIKAIKTIKTNINNFNIEDKTKVLNLDYKKALEVFKKDNVLFDVIFLDPPYKLDIWKNNTCEMLVSLLKPNGLIICEFDEIYPYDINESLEIFKERDYGSKRIVIFQKK